MKRLVVLSLIMCASVFLLMGCANESSSNGFTGTRYNMVEVYDDGWFRVLADTANGSLSRTVTLDEESLYFFHVWSINDAGTVKLVFTQGNVTKTVDLTTSVLAKRLDLSSFAPDTPLTLRIDYSEAEMVHTLMIWYPDLLVCC